MYQVVKIYGDWEPWWSLENWQEDIIETKCFDDFEEARAFTNKNAKHSNHLYQVVNAMTLSSSFLEPRGPTLV